MDVRLIVNLSLLILALSHCLQARGESKGSVVFLGGSSQRYIRSNPQDAAWNVHSVTLNEVAATMSVLLGFAPSSSLPADSSDKKADLQFSSALVSLIRNVKKAVEIHQDLSESSVELSEIMMGHFTGIEALREEYGWGDITRQGLELLQATLKKLSDTLQVSYRGKIVGVIISNNELSSESEKLLGVTFGSRTSRMLEEVSFANSTNQKCCWSDAVWLG
ncbi:hypothetical protein Cni_G26243 [Canna indica]|uniref:DUF7794 domain-containing protein n=1 Tax=Canna indica TaxID=4628 RepID=A0AAQ3QLU1_9LILI|nr:hypothetical protein Cni_G26243 [Canna indica]